MGFLKLSLRLNEFFSDGENIFVFYLGVFGYMFTILSLIYIHFNLELLNCFKTLLVTQTVLTLCMVSVQSVGFLIAVVDKSQTVIICTFWISPVGARFAANAFFNMMYSIGRLHVAELVARNQTVNQTKVKNLGLLSSTFYFAFWACVFVCGAIGNMHFSPYVADCAGTSYSMVFGIVILLSTVTTIWVSILCDINLVLLVRHQNNTRPLRMEAWSAQKHSKTQ